MAVARQVPTQITGSLKDKEAVCLFSAESCMTSLIPHSLPRMNVLHRLSDEHEYWYTPIVIANKLF